MSIFIRAIQVLVRSERAELGTRSFNTVGNLVPHLVGNGSLYFSVFIVSCGFVIF